MSQNETNFNVPPLFTMPPPTQVEYGRNVGYGFPLPTPVVPPGLPAPPPPIPMPSQFIQPPSIVPPQLPQFAPPPPQLVPPQLPQFAPPPPQLVPPPSMTYVNIPPWNQFNAHQPPQLCPIIPQECPPTVLQIRPPIGCEPDENISQDQKWVQSWLEQIRKLRNTTEKKNTTTDVKIYEIKELLSAVISIIKELENASVTLNVMAKSVTDIEWKKKCQEIEIKKEELSQLLQALKLDPLKMTEIKNKLNKRKAKRDRLKRQALKRKEEKKARNENKEKLHQQIDSWLEDMKESVERSRREEELKREADSVLWEVTQKKTEAKKQISLLTSLLQLRDAKATALKSTGKHVSDSEISTFNTVIEKLKTMWERQLDGYLLEEQGLRVMLTEDAEKKDSHGVHAKQILLEWEMAIFGNKCNEMIGEPHDLEEFLKVRQDWDHFVANEKTVMASTIPIGWVLPTKPSNENWAKCLKTAK